MACQWCLAQRAHRWMAMAQGQTNTVGHDPYFDGCQQQTAYCPTAAYRQQDTLMDAATNHSPASKPSKHLTPNPAMQVINSSDRPNNMVTGIPCSAETTAESNLLWSRCVHNSADMWLLGPRCICACFSPICGACTIAKRAPMAQYFALLSAAAAPGTAGSPAS
jgi:hypothetical protein